MTGMESIFGAVSTGTLLLLAGALLLAFSFETINGFHDTANAVATVIYTNTLKPWIAVIWSGLWNFTGVLLSSGAVAFGIVALLPVELVIHVGTAAGFAMVFSLLLAALIWNFATWYVGIPASSSHTLIGSIVGVGLMNAYLSGRPFGDGVNWGKVQDTFAALLFSPLIGFIGAGLLLLLMKFLIRNPKLYESPVGDTPPVWWIRALLVLTCTGVSFAHGSNDGQKGMGLIMLILIGTVPPAYALNHAVTAKESVEFVAVSAQASQVLSHYESPVATATTTASAADAGEELTRYVRSRSATPQTVTALRGEMDAVASQIAAYKELRLVPADQTSNVRNELYLIGETMRLMGKSATPKFSEADAAVLKNYKQHADEATRFIPLWVKVSVALALGLGTMVGWKRIVVTVGEKIGKDHLTYAQGAAAEVTAMVTIGAADALGLPVSTTHVLSSGVAGTMAANHSGLQWSTVRNMLMAWVLTLPVSILLSGVLFWIFRGLH